MDYGLYTAFLGMRARQRTLEAQANNIANASTTGYKADRLQYGLVEANQKGTSEGQKLALGVTTTNKTDFSQGAVRETGNSLDVSINGDGFLQIQTDQGVRFTRAGNLSINADGQLVTKSGDFVVGDGGPITVPPGAGEPVIGKDGTLSIDGNNFDKLKIVRFENPVAALRKEGSALFALTGEGQPQEDVQSSVLQGTLESSNVNSISEMVAMMNNNREFESLQRSISLMMNDLGRKISSEIGRF